MTIQDQIFERLVDRLNGVGVPADVLATKPANLVAREFTPERIDFEAEDKGGHLQRVIEILPVKEPVEQVGSARSNAVKRTLSFTADIWGAIPPDAPTTPVRSIVSPLCAWVTRALQWDPSLGNGTPGSGLAMNLEEGNTDWDQDAAYGGVAHATVTINVTYATNRNNQETQP